MTHEVISKITTIISDALANQIEPASCEVSVASLGDESNAIIRLLESEHELIHDVNIQIHFKIKPQ